MPDPRNPDTLARLMRVRRAVETAIGKLSDMFAAQTTKASEALSIAWSESSSPTTSPSWLHNRDSQKTRESGFWCKG